MIVGLGSDICNIERIEKAYRRFGQRFLFRCFGKEELSELKNIENDPKRLVASLAKRFAAKESFVKALGSGFNDGISWAEIEVLHQANGRPVLKISGEAERMLKQIAKETNLWLSLSDDHPWAQAVVVIEQK